MQGAADPWGIAVASGGKTLWVSLAGTHQVARIDIATVHAWIEGKLPENHQLAQAAVYAPGTESIWLRIKRDPAQKVELMNDLAALAGADLIQRISVAGKGPRGIAVSPDGKIVAAACYFSGGVAIVDADAGKPKGSIALGPAQEPDLARKGEAIFHDAGYCFQQWLSCATCHPEGRTDGMNWDLLNDGIGNPKNVHSLLLSDRTPPAMSHGVRAAMAEAVKAGFIHILFHQPEEQTLRATEAYLKAMPPVPSPRLAADGGLSEKAKRGKALFDSPRTQCSTCHPAPLYTDLKPYDVGTKGEFDRTTEYDNPTLVELWRTAPYLHDGSAVDLREALVDRNKEDKHGKTTGLSAEEMEELIEFLLSL
jgi:mono/diheme cytochrome c family protein